MLKRLLLNNRRALGYSFRSNVELGAAGTHCQKVRNEFSDL